ncbi:MAG: peptide ABC transporter substrate-binding protein [Phenylobacterium sp.]|uniref:peptide ABC transporter substrate-binding protein n=1 Tax=Phenylobacterium sp. TaxID=1871053 RepID=UPI002732F217|nr:peptide ABC transporter substrate-binding protein [Phenylobacterium sp.]MDP3173100.1 peptide ABC transporter substrate-binding protein [Phenylobacterium sp.]
MPLGLALAAAALLLAGCGGKVQRPDCSAGQVCLEYGNGSEPATLDPQSSSLIDEFAIIGDLMMGLTTDSPEAMPVPGMAERWETSADGLVWTFHLRDAKWSDGAPVTADDFVYAYRRILEPKTASVYAYLVFLLKNGQAVSEGKADPQTLGARALDPRTLELTLSHPAPYLPQLLKHTSFFPVPKHVVERYGDQWVRPGRYVSNGPYKLAAWRLGDYVQLVKNPLFYDAKNVCVDRVNFYPTTDSALAERRVQRGELDLNTSFQSNRIDRLRKEMPTYVRTHPSLATSYLSFNTRDFAPFKDVRVRKALALAIDREFITSKLMRAGQIPAYAFVPPGTANYVFDAHMAGYGQAYPARQAEARRLLAQAGFGPDHPLKFQIKSASSNETLLLMQAIQADWKAVGVETSLQQNEGQIVFEAYRNRDFQVGSMGWYADYNDPVTFLALMRADTGAQNYGDYRNPAYDALLDAADHEPDGMARAKLLSRAEQIMLDDQAIAPIYFVVNRALVSPKVTGWVDNASNFHRIRWLCVKP